MMNFRDEETYQFFEDTNNANENQQFEFKDSYWDEMEAMLDAHDTRKRKRRAAFIWFSSVSVALIFLFGLHFLGVFGLSAGENSRLSSTVQLDSQINLSNPHSNESEVQVSLVKSDQNQKKLTQSNIEMLFSNMLPASAHLYKSTTTSKRNQLNKGRLQKQPNVINMKSDAILVSEHKEGLEIENRIAQNSYKSTDGVTENELESMAFLASPQLTNESSQSIKFEVRKPKFRTTHHLYASAETGLVNAYGVGNGVSFGVVAGLGYEIGFHKNMAFQIGAQLNYREGMHQNYLNESKVYGFKSERYYQQVDYKGQFELEIPLALKVRFKRHSLNAGVGTSFLLGVRSTLEQRVPESEGVETIQSNFGIRNGIRNMDVKLNFQYGYAVSPNLELTAGVSAGLLDQTSNEFFGNTIKDHNLQLRLGIKYFFFNK
ncbi:MAG: outer membrane beta-barrel protein [Crocinitomicaceae bacterium]